MERDIAALCAALADEVDHIGMPMYNLVVGLVERGQIVPDEAEAWARESGAEPFAQTPDPAKFDPMAEPDWTLAMATAWAIWRTPEAVRRVWGRFLQACTSWERYEATLLGPYGLDGRAHIVGSKLVQPGPKAPDDVLRSEVVWTAMAKASPTWCPDPPLIGAEQAKNELRTALRMGAPLVARHGTMTEVVDRHVWGALSPFDDGQGGPEDVHDRGGVVRFHRVRVERDAVLAVWPAPPVPDAFALAAAGVMSMPADGREVRPAEGMQEPEVVTLSGPVEVRSAGASQGAEARAAKSDHAQRRIAFLREKVPDLTKQGALAAVRRHSDEFQELHGKKPVERSQHGKDIRALRQRQK